MQVKEVFQLVIERNFTNINSATGMVWKLCEELQNLPMTNKAAYRRVFLDKIVVLKDTIREFGEYIEEAKAAAALATEAPNAGGVVVSVDDEDDGEDDDEDECYTPEQTAVAEGCMLLVGATMNAIKIGLGAMTLVADSWCPAAGASTAAGYVAGGSEVGDVKTVPVNELASVFATTLSMSEPPALHLVDQSSKGRDAEDRKMVCGRWVSNLTSHVGGLESAVIDLGAELYPPFDAAIITANYSELKSKLVAFYCVLEVEEFRAALLPNSEVTASVVEGKEQARSMELHIDRDC